MSFFPPDEVVVKKFCKSRKNDCAYKSDYKNSPGFFLHKIKENIQQIAVNTPKIILITMVAITYNPFKNSVRGFAISSGGISSSQV